MKRILFFAVAFATTTDGARRLAPTTTKQLKYRHIGPVGNRIASVAGVPGDPLTYYAGAATGGIWKSVDGGEYWKPIFDGQPDHAIGALAVAPSDPQIIWAGTGEPHIRSNVAIGSGVYKSTDGGETWQEMNMKWPSRTARIVIHPTNPDIVYVAALGHSHGPQQERGIFRTLDGGATWKHVLAVDENTGAFESRNGSEQPTHSLRGHVGSSPSTPGADKAAAKGAGSTSPKTGVRLGPSSRATGSRSFRSAKSTSV